MLMDWKENVDCWNYNLHFEDYRGGMSTMESLIQRTWRGLGPLNCPFDECAVILCFVCGDGSMIPFPH